MRGDNCWSPDAYSWPYHGHIHICPWILYKQDACYDASLDPRLQTSLSFPAYTETLYMYDNTSSKTISLPHALISHQYCRLFIFAMLFTFHYFLRFSVRLWLPIRGKENLWFGCTPHTLLPWAPLSWEYQCGVCRLYPPHHLVLTPPVDMLSLMSHYPAPDSM